MVARTPFKAALEAVALARNLEVRKAEIANTNR